MNCGPLNTSGRAERAARRRLWVVLMGLGLAGLLLGLHLYREYQGAREVARLGGRVQWELGCVRYVYELDTIRDDDLARLVGELEGLACIKSLSVANSRVTDSGLDHLQRLTSLRWLYLGGTRTTDAGISHLKKLEHLEYLDLSGTGMTDAGVNDLRAALPRLQKIRR